MRSVQGFKLNSRDISETGCGNQKCTTYPLQAIGAASSKGCEQLHGVVAHIEVLDACGLLIQEPQQHWNSVWALGQQLGIDCVGVRALQQRLQLEQQCHALHAMCMIGTHLCRCTRFGVDLAV